MKLHFYLILPFFSLFALIACDKDEATDKRHDVREDIVLTKSQLEFVQQGNQLGFKLLNELIQEKEDACALSPLSAQIALGMLSVGADGVTEEQLLSLLGFSEDATETIQYLSSLCEQLKLMDRKTDLSLSNLLLLNSLFADRFLSSYTQTLSSYYDAIVRSRDFGMENKEALVNEINSWSNQHTNGHIPQLLEPEDIRADVVSCLMNALYFNSQWAVPFKKENTRQDDFTSTDGAVRRVPMMFQKKTHLYYENDELQAVTLGYGNGAFCFTTILPKDGVSVLKIVEELKDGLFGAINNLASYETVAVSLPAFENVFTVDMIPLCSSFGLTSAFDELNADFSKMISLNGVYVSSFKQKLFIRVNEQGAEASAVTHVETSEVTGPEEELPWKEFKANHPFLYVISETSSQTILLTGLFS